MLKPFCPKADGLVTLLPSGTTLLDTTTSVPETRSEVAKNRPNMTSHFLDASCPLEFLQAAAAGTMDMSMVIGGDVNEPKRVLPIS